MPHLKISHNSSRHGLTFFLPYGYVICIKALSEFFFFIVCPVAENQDQYTVSTKWILQYCYLLQLL